MRLRSFRQADKYISWSSVFVGRVVSLFDDGGGADDVVGGGFAAGGLDTHAYGQALPLSRLADGDEVVCFRPFANLLLNDSTSRTQLGDDCEETAFGCSGDAAVGGVVAKPDTVRDGRVEVGQMERCDVAGDAVDGEPRARLPDSVRGCVVGRASLSRRARRTVKVRSVMS